MHMMPFHWTTKRDLSIMIWFSVKTDSEDIFGQYYTQYISYSDGDILEPFCKREQNDISDTESANHLPFTHYLVSLILKW